MASPGDDRCYLLELPAELRNRIYEFVVIEDEAVNIYNSLRWDLVEKRYFANLLEPAIAATCWQLREESLSIYYSSNTFSMDFEMTYDDLPNNFEFLGWYFDKLGEEGCGLLTQVDLTIWCKRKPRVRDLIPLVRVFSRRSGAALPKVSSISLHYIWMVKGRRNKRNEWIAELGRELAEIGRLLQAKGLAGSGDEVIKAAIRQWLPWWKWKIYEGESQRLLQDMGFKSNGDFEMWLLPYLDLVDAYRY